MRNQKLLNLQQIAEKANADLFAYLNHLNKRETDPSYVHARMLFEEGFRLGTVANKSYGLWTTNELMITVDPENKESDNSLGIMIAEAKSISDKSIISKLGLTKVRKNSDNEAVLNFLFELTEESNS